MGVMLYRQGESHKVRGIPCEMGVFPADELEHRLQEGWVTDPIDAYDVTEPEPEPEPESKDEPVAVPDNGVSEIDLTAMNNAEIRSLARIQNHPKWDTARVETLKRFLDNGRDTES